MSYQHLKQLPHCFNVFDRDYNISTIKIVHNIGNQIENRLFANHVGLLLFRNGAVHVEK